MRTLLALIAVFAIGAAVLFWRERNDLQQRLDGFIAAAGENRASLARLKQVDDDADALDRGFSRALNGADAIAKAFAGLKTGPDQAPLRADISAKMIKLAADLTPAAGIARALLLAAQPPGFTLDPAKISDTANAAFLAKTDADAAFKKTPSGLRYRVVKEGAGPRPAPASEVSVTYRGRFIDGTEFDSTDKAGGAPVTFPLDKLIAGWSEGIPLMNEGATYEFVVPYDLAYGVAGRGSIPPRQTLVFDVDLLHVATPTAALPAERPAPR